MLGTRRFPRTSAGYRQLLAWLTGDGRLIRVGIEGTGGYRAELACYLAGAKVEAVEVNRANRQLRRRRGKSDTPDSRPPLEQRSTPRR